MPTYDVTFAAPVVYLPGAPPAYRRTLQTLRVHAADPDDARAHALRSTAGCYTITGCQQVKPLGVPAAPPAEAPHA